MENTNWTVEQRLEVISKIATKIVIELPGSWSAAMARTIHLVATSPDRFLELNAAQIERDAAPVADGAKR